MTEQLVVLIGFAVSLVNVGFSVYLTNRVTKQVNRRSREIVYFNLLGQIQIHLIAASRQLYHESPHFDKALRKAMNITQTSDSQLEIEIGNYQALLAQFEKLDSARFDI